MQGLVWSDWYLRRRIERIHLSNTYQYHALEYTWTSFDTKLSRNRLAYRFRFAFLPSLSYSTPSHRRAVLRAKPIVKLLIETIHYTRRTSVTPLVYRHRTS